MSCPQVTIQTINGNECIGDSLPKINNNFTALETVACNLIGLTGTFVKSVQGTSPVTVTGTTAPNISINTQSLTALLDDYFVPTNQSSSFGVPTGFVSYYSLSSAPTGWMECNGTALSATMGQSYQTLRTLLINAGNPHGVSGSDPKVPDLRGRFIRSFGTDSTVSPVVSSDAFGAKQADAFQGHYHTTTGTRYAAGGFDPNGDYGDGAQHLAAAVTAASTDGTNGTPRTASETRPANIALLACIKL